jgi:hypothetical protein
MSEKERQREVFVEKRARALAVMLLTRRDDLQLKEVTDNVELDYVVRFHTQGKDGLREFGVALRGHRAALTKEQADEVLRPALRQLKGYGPFLRPVCLFLFTMEGDGGWYTWVAQPVASADDKSVLRSCDEPDCRPLDRRALRAIIESVDLWYDSVFASLIVNGPEGGKSGRKQARQ